MLKLIETLRAKPSDKNIRIIRVVFAMILLGVIYFGFAKTTWNFELLPQELLYVLYIFPLIGLIRGIFDPGLWRKKLWKWTQVALGVLMMVVSIFLIETDTRSAPISSSTNLSGELSALSLTAETKKSGVIDTDFWIGFLGFWLALAGITLASKNITKKNERHGEKVTKIRV